MCLNKNLFFLLKLQFLFAIRFHLYYKIFYSKTFFEYFMIFIKVFESLFLVQNLQNINTYFI